MGKRPTPAPGPTALQRVSVLFALVSGTILVGVGMSTGWVWPYFAALPSLFIFCRLAYGKLLILHFLLRYGRSGIHGVLVTSDSPVWKDYIQENWLDRFGSRFIVLNASRCSQWHNCPATRLYFFFCPQVENYCPAVLLLRGILRPHVYRFFYAFRDHKHGNDTALLKLEEDLARELSRQ